MATNPGEQFYAFTSLVAWILNQCGISAERPQEVSPNSSNSFSMSN